MNYKKIKYGTGEGIVKIRIEEDTGALLENWTIMMSDLSRWAKLMRKKYGSQIESKEDKDRDLDWLR